MDEFNLTEFIEMLSSVKIRCAELDCAECPFSVGIYQEGLDYTYYFCDIRKRPREWDLEKKRLKQDKNKKPKKKKRTKQLSEESKNKKGDK